MTVDIESIRAFTVVAELHSFHDAAKALNLSAPALTRRVQKLESGLGVDLLKRTTRRVEVTLPGREFLPKARKLLDEFAQATRTGLTARDFLQGFLPGINPETDDDDDRGQRNVARRQRSQEAEHFVARQLPVQNLTIIAVDSVDLKPSLGDIQSDPSDLTHVACLRLAVENRP